MSLSITAGSTATVDLVDGEYAPWDDLSRHPNEKACNPWAMHVTERGDDYPLDGDWLDKQWIGGGVHFDVGDLAPGDVVKVSGASHGNRKHVHLLVRSLDAAAGEMTVERLTEGDAIERVAGRDAAADLRTEVLGLVRECDDPGRLERVRKVLQGTRVDSAD